ncbi:MAG: Lar family restriction alleviation protein [Aquabacterium commune]|uniref:Lar family restriction alleviation protein n=1 Tax=Aquabacterium commune TaxID=70586 RepID=UPI003BAE7F7E
MTEQTQPTDAELEACPFCGNANAIVYDDLLTFHAGCLSCGATGSVSSYRNGAIAAWNRRAVLAKWGTPAGAGEPVAKLWLWKNFVGGKPEYWAFDNPFPCVSAGGDPLTLGEPCGWALLKPSVNGRPQRSEQEVTNTVYRLHATPQPTQAQAGAVPLAVDEVEQLIAQWSYELHGDRARYLVRMTEQHHGIKGKETGNAD